MVWVLDNPLRYDKLLDKTWWSNTAQQNARQWQPMKRTAVAGIKTCDFVWFTYQMVSHKTWAFWSLTQNRMRTEQFQAGTRRLTTHTHTHTHLPPRSKRVSPRHSFNTFKHSHTDKLGASSWRLTSRPTVLQRWRSSATPSGRIFMKFIFGIFSKICRQIAILFKIKVTGPLYEDLRTFMLRTGRNRRLALIECFLWGNG